jgi:prepilin-type N-terminal cleavage/methylation domain-containing protein
MTNDKIPMTNKNKRAFSLVELVLVIVIAGISIPGVIITFYELSRKSIYDEAMTSAVMLAEGELERATRKSFANVLDEHRDSPISFAGNFSAYSWQVRVDYVESTDLDAAVAWPTDYKLVESRVTNNIIGDVALKIIVTNN